MKICNLCEVGMNGFKPCAFHSPIVAGDRVCWIDSDGRKCRGQVLAVNGGDLSIDCDDHSGAIVAVEICQKGE